MLNLDPYEPVSNQPAISRDMSICVVDPDMELLGDRIRDALGERGGWVGGVCGTAPGLRLRVSSRCGPPASWHVAWTAESPDPGYAALARRLHLERGGEPGLRSRLREPVRGDRGIFPLIRL
jgi:hypothetical protein